MAPEVVLNSNGYNFAVDIWSLGCAILEMTTSKPPWGQYEGVTEMIKEAAPECPALSAQQVADAFMLQYYHILRASPENLRKFYKDYSIMAHLGSEGTMVSATTTMQREMAQNSENGNFIEIIQMKLENGCEIDEETSNKLEGLPGVLSVLPDSYVDAENKDYGAELLVNGEIVKRSPVVQPVPQRAQDRPRYNDRTRYNNTDVQTRDK